MNDESYEKWKIDKEEGHWMEVSDPEGWWQASVKWDGCIHLNRYYNNPKGEDDVSNKSDEDDYIHICDLDDYIDRLVELREIARKRWPDNYRPND